MFGTEPPLPGYDQYFWRVNVGFWELLNGGCVFVAMSSTIIIFTDMQDIPVPNVIPKVLLDVICRLESDELQFTWKLSRNKEGFSLSVNQVKVPAKRDSRDPGKTTVDVEAKPLKKAKKKSPSTLAHDRARRKRYRKKSKKLGTLERVKLPLQTRGWILWHHNLQRNQPVIVSLMN